MKNKKRILICPLDWGMGHATRMMPVIDHLAPFYEVHVAAGANTLLVIKNRYPDLPTHLLPKISPRYTKKREDLVPMLLVQTPIIFLKVLKEHFVMRSLVKKHNISAVISDNRFGCWGLQVPSAYVTHQVHFKLGGRLGLFTPLFEWGHRLVINCYNQVFIPDVPSEDRLGGKLSASNGIKVPFSYLGLLSRMNTNKDQQERENFGLILLSGQEPQRTILEKIILDQVGELDKHFVLVKGKLGIPGDSSTRAPKNVDVISFVDGKKLEDLLYAAEFVICRSGYSSLMDLILNHKRAIVIPTPGQAEQEYLAQNAKKKHWFVGQKQDEIDIAEGLKQIMDYDPPVYMNSETDLSPIEHWLNSQVKD